MTRSRLIVLLIVVALIGAFFAFDLERFFTLEALKAQQAANAAYRDAHPIATAGAYFLLYIVVTGLSLPGAAVLTLCSFQVRSVQSGSHQRRAVVHDHAHRYRFEQRLHTSFGSESLHE